VQLLDASDLLALVVLEQVDRLLAHDAGDLPAARLEQHALADEDLRVPAADAAEAQEAVVVDVRDDETDLVDVADDRQRRAAGGSRHPRPHRAHHVGDDLGERGGRVAEHGSRRRLVARWTVSGDERAQNRRDRHRRTLDDR
jgi:hypothetical protein